MKIFQPTRQQVLDCINQGYGFLGNEGELTKEYIILAVNAHEELLEALKSLLALNLDGSLLVEEAGEAKYYKKIIAKAEGK